MTSQKQNIYFCLLLTVNLEILVFFLQFGDDNGEFISPPPLQKPCMELKCPVLFWNELMSIHAGFYMIYMVLHVYVFTEKLFLW